MLLVIFGAGASYDSVHHLPPFQPSVGFVKNLTPVAPPRVPSPHEVFRPPLANQLFDTRELFANLMNGQYGDMRPLVPRLRSSAIAVEQHLAKFEEEAKSYPNGPRQMVAVLYYLRSAVMQCQNRWHQYHRGTNNYVTFLDMLERWRCRVNQPVCLVTFNYDTMLEQAIEQVLRNTFQDFGRYINYDNYKVIKPHGSIDWGHEIAMPFQPNSVEEVLEMASTLQVAEYYKKVADEWLHFENNPGIGFPAIAIPVEKKYKFSCPAEHVNVLANFIPNVTKIITVGWRATEKNFLDMLKSPLTGLKGDVDLMVISGDEKGMKETTNNLAIGGPSPTRKRALRDDGFTGLIDNIWHLEAFLRD